VRAGEVHAPCAGTQVEHRAGVADDVQRVAAAFGFDVTQHRVDVGIVQRRRAFARTREPLIGCDRVARADRPQAEQHRRPWRRRVAVVQRLQQRPGAGAIAAVVVRDRLAEQARAIGLRGMHVARGDAVASVDRGRFVPAHQDDRNGQQDDRGECDGDGRGTAPRFGLRRGWRDAGRRRGSLRRRWHRCYVVMRDRHVGFGSRFDSRRGGYRNGFG
jgi:hypothetical protein